MISKEEYVMKSLELHLFWARIMKEHMLFLEASIAGKSTKLIKEAGKNKMEFEKILEEAVKLSDGNIRECVLVSGELFTEYTLDAERKTKDYTGLGVNCKTTEQESKLRCSNKKIVDAKTWACVKSLNCKSIKMLDKLIEFKSKVLNEVLCCSIFTSNYPSMLEHIIEEAKRYKKNIKDIENNIDVEKYKSSNIEDFWNDIMKEHALFIRGMLDPSEEKLIELADRFAMEFKDLMKNKSNMNDGTGYTTVNDTLTEIAKIINFKKSGTKGILSCEIKSVILPLLSDHVLREANHYMRILENYEK